MGLVHRREIDGLRAIAVASVVAYHAGLGGAGYVGVDIFFVISGYLITALLLLERDSTGGVDLWQFYARRARRILPAAAVVLLAVVAIMHALAPVAETAKAAASAAASALFVANLYFQAQLGGYWAGDAAQLPLLHLWSLAVEEQFYLAWPLLLMLVPRSRLPLALSVLAIASLALAEWLLRSRPEAAFYQMPARAWELAAGALVATMPPRRLPAGTTWAALLLLLAACILPIGHFPGLGALPAVAAAALLLAAIHAGDGNALLASRPMVGIGLISYSLYLWHWPLLAIDRLLRGGDSPLSLRLALVATAFALAIASYRYVETPFRRWQAPTRRIVGVGAVAMLGIALTAWEIRVEPAGPMSSLTSAQRVAADHPAWGVCNYYPLQAIEPFPEANCAPPDAAVASWGDSMANSWQPYARSLGSPFIGFSRANCPPLLGVEIHGQARVQAALCEAFNARVAGWIVEHKPRTVVIAGRWSFHAVGSQVEVGLRASLLRIGPSVQRIVVIGPSPELPDTLPKCLELGLDCSVSRARVEADNLEVTSILTRLDALPKVEVVGVLPFLCTASRCPGIRNGVPLYSDSLHISSRAARAYGVTAASHREGR